MRAVDGQENPKDKVRWKSEGKDFYPGNFEFDKYSMGARGIEGVRILKMNKIFLDISAPTPSIFAPAHLRPSASSA
jgi:hypothetical protein